MRWRFALAAVLLVVGGFALGDVTENVQYLPLHRVTADRPGLLLNNPFGGAPAAPGVDPRWDGLFAGWHLDEVSDGSGAVNRVDVLGAFDLTDNNTVTSAVGLIVNAASFAQGTTEYLTHANIYNFSGTWTLVTWVKVSGTTNFRGVYRAGASGNRAYFNSGTYTLVVEVAGFTPPGFSSALDDGWHMLTVWHDDSDDTVGCSFDGAAATTFNPRNLSSDGAFALGATTPTGTNPFNGLMDETYLFSVVKSDADIASIYNSGTGVAYPN